VKVYQKIYMIDKILIFWTSIYQKILKIILNKKNQILFYFHLEHNTNRAIFRKSLSTKKIFGEWQKINQTKAVELETKRWIKFASTVSHLSGETKTWWRDNYVFLKTIIYSGGKPKLNFIWSKSHHEKKQEKSI